MSSKRGKKQKGKQRKTNSRFSDHNISQIHQHKRHGSKLSPPFVQLRNMRQSSWADDHMPEMLWAVLLTGTINRNDYFDIFRRLAILCREWFITQEAKETANDNPEGDTGENFKIIVDHTKLAEISDEQFQAFISIPLSHPLGYAALRPLLLLESLPAASRWKEALKIDPVETDWQTMAGAIAGVLDHQSEKSTDIRWLKLIIPIISGNLFFDESMSERLEELRVFPDKGDMRSVRPFIRSGEMTLRRNPPTAWVKNFWGEVTSKTRCVDPSEKSGYVFVETTIDPTALYAARDDICQKFSLHIDGSRTDARLDSAFGLVLYALSIVEEIGFHRTQTRIISRLALRTLVEINITLNYLAKHDDMEMWSSYRVYGAGQAKLAFLKAQEINGELPPFLDEEALYAIANEDRWQEYLSIDIGHWANSNLRQLSIDCGEKNLYDKYYDWTSAFAHGHWGAVRDTNFITCHNPLHRLHRIPRVEHRLLNSVETDAIELANTMIETLERLFPNGERIGRLALLSPDQCSPNTDSSEPKTT